MQDDVLHILHELMRGGNVRCLFSIEEVESILSQLSEVLAVKERSECLLSSRELWRLFVKVHVQDNSFSGNGYRIAGNFRGVKNSFNSKTAIFVS